MPETRRQNILMKNLDLSKIVVIFPHISIMLYNLKIDDYLKVLTDEEVNDFPAISFSEYLKLIREEQTLEKTLNHFISS